MIPTKPITRIEKYLDGIINDTTLPNPITRIEQYLSKISGDDIDVPEKPITRIEMYLAKIAGEDVEIPEKPITRIEMYLAAIAGEEITVPEPITREEQYLYEWANIPKAEVVTVTGISPLLLAAAYGSPLRSLTQYGKCEQASTPTPASPVDIVCNNGALRMVDDELPIGYKRLLDVTTEGSMRYVSNIHITGADTLKFTYKSSPGNLLGAYHDSDADDNYSYYPTTSTTAKYARYNGQTGGSSSATGTEYTVEMSPTGITGTRNPSSFTPSTFTASVPFCIFATSPTGTPMSNGTIYGSIKISGSQSVKFIPCERSSDGAIGYYDTLNDEFLASQGDGVPSTSGYDGSHLSLGVVGTPEVISVTASGADTQTASVPNLFAVGDYADEVEIIRGGVKRKVGVKVFDGSEYNSWTVQSNRVYTSRSNIGMNDSDRPDSGAITCLSTHYADSSTNSVRINNSAMVLFYYDMASAGITTSAEWNAYLAAQYAAGTPVIVLYPLAEETTEQITVQPLSTTDGDNVIKVTANCDNITLEATYERKVS